MTAKRRGHEAAPTVPSQCARFHDLVAFLGGNRTCTRSLEVQRARRADFSTTAQSCNVHGPRQAPQESGREAFGYATAASHPFPAQYAIPSTVPVPSACVWPAAQAALQAALESSPMEFVAPTMSDFRFEPPSPARAG